MKTGTKINGITFYRVNNDVNGNPRYVVHFLDIADEYNEAHKRAKSLGGRKYTASWFGGGFVFQSYNINGLADKIFNLKSKDFALNYKGVELYEHTDISKPHPFRDERDGNIYG